MQMTQTTSSDAAPFNPTLNASALRTLSATRVAATSTLATPPAVPADEVPCSCPTCFPFFA